MLMAVLVSNVKIILILDFKHTLCLKTILSFKHFKLNKYVNLDMEDLTDWLNANEISLNVHKAELVLFKHQRKKIVKLRLN